MLTLIDLLVMAMVVVAIACAHWIVQRGLDAEIDRLEHELVVAINSLSLITIPIQHRHEFIYAEFQLHCAYNDLYNTKSTYIKWLHLCIERKSMTVEDLQ